MNEKDTAYVGRYALECYNAFSQLQEEIIYRPSHRRSPLQSPLQSGRKTEELYPNTGRNEPCPCGSGKKYKKCCKRI